MFSCILCTRSRPTLLRDCLHHLTANALRPPQILLACDDDDSATLDVLPALAADYGAVGDVRPRDRNLSRRLNRLATMATGRYVFVLNDDAQVRVKAWDGIAAEYLSRYAADGVIYGATQDDSHDRAHWLGGYSPFPILGMPGVRAAGVFDEVYHSWGADSSLWRVYESIGRVVTIPVRVAHVMHNGEMSPDGLLRAEMVEHTEANPVPPVRAYDVAPMAERLRAAIRQSPG